MLFLLAVSWWEIVGVKTTVAIVSIVVAVITRSGRCVHVYKLQWLEVYRVKTKNNNEKYSWSHNIQSKMKKHERFL